MKVLKVTQAGKIRFPKGKNRVISMKKTWPILITALLCIFGIFGITQPGFAIPDNAPIFGGAVYIDEPGNPPPPPTILPVYCSHYFKVKVSKAPQCEGWAWTFDRWEYEWVDNTTQTNSDGIYEFGWCPPDRYVTVYDPYGSPLWCEKREYEKNDIHYWNSKTTIHDFSDNIANPAVDYSIANGPNTRSGHNPMDDIQWEFTATPRIADHVNLIYVHGWTGDEDDWVDFHENNIYGLLDELEHLHVGDLENIKEFYTSQDATTTGKLHQALQIADEIYENTDSGLPYVFVTHSMGGIVTLSLLELGYWVNRYINENPNDPNLQNINTIGDFLCNFFIHIFTADDEKTTWPINPCDITTVNGLLLWIEQQCTGEYGYINHGTVYNWHQCDMYRIFKDFNSARAQELRNTLLRVRKIAYHTRYAFIVHSPVKGICQSCDGWIGYVVQFVMSAIGVSEEHLAEDCILSEWRNYDHADDVLDNNGLGGILIFDKVAAGTICSGNMNPLLGGTHDGQIEESRMYGGEEYENKIIFSDPLCHASSQTSLNQRLVTEVAHRLYGHSWTPPGCPYVSTYFNGEYLKDNTILASKIDTMSDPNREDVYLIQKPMGVENGKYRIMISEDEREVSYFDKIELWAADYKPEVRVAVASDGTIITYNGVISPVSCVDQNERDVLTLIKYSDDKYFQGYKGDQLVVEFENVNSLSQKETGFIINLVEKANAQATSVIVEVLQKDGWKEVGIISPRENWSRYLIVLPKSYKSDNPNKIKLRLTWTDKHKLYFIGLFNPVETEVDLHNCEVKSASHSRNGSVVGMISAADFNYAELKPGEAMKLSFTVPAKEDGFERKFILKTTGYYTTGAFPENPLSSGTSNRNPTDFSIRQLSCPCADKTTMKYQIPTRTHTTLKVYDIVGQLVRTLVDEEQTSGYYSIIWDGTDNNGKRVGQGTYFCRMISTPKGSKIKKFEATKKIVLLR